MVWRIRVVYPYPPDQGFSTWPPWHLGLDNSLLWKVVLSIVRCLAAALASSPRRQQYSPPSCNQQKVCRYCQESPGVGGRKITLEENRCLRPFIWNHTLPHPGHGEAVLTLFFFFFPSLNYHSDCRQEKKAWKK